MKRYKQSLFAYAVRAVIVSLMAVHLFLMPSRLNFIIYGCVAVIGPIVLLFWQHVVMQAEKREMGIP